MTAIFLKTLLSYVFLMDNMAALQPQLVDIDPSGCDPDCEVPDNSRYVGLVHNEKSAYDLLTHADQKARFSLCNLKSQIL